MFCLLPRDASDLELFLSGLTLSNYLELFQRENISLKDLLSGAYEEDDLVRVGVDKLGDRKRIVEEIARLVKTSWTPSSLPSLRTSQNLRYGVALIALKSA